MNTEDHGRNNAKAGAENIAAMVAALECDYERLEELRDECAALRAECGDKHSYHDTAEMRKAREELGTWLEENGDELTALAEAAGEFTNNDDARERIQEDPLSVEVRSGWTSPGGDMVAEEFCILLTTGGPALRIRGELDQYKQPRRAWLEYQDWGTPWTQFFNIEQSTLLTYCQQFYFGE